MHNKPFRFLDSLTNLEQLRHNLAQVGLSEVEASHAFAQANPYKPACLRFACRWLPEPVELQWNYYWWPDGMYSELGSVRVIYKGAIWGEVEVEELLRQRLERPLSEIIIDGIVAICAGLTGKHTKHPKRKQKGGKEQQNQVSSDSQIGKTDQ